MTRKRMDWLALGTAPALLLASCTADEAAQDETVVETADDAMADSEYPDPSGTIAEDAAATDAAMDAAEAADASADASGGDNDGTWVPPD